MVGAKIHLLAQVFQKQRLTFWFRNFSVSKLLPNMHSKQNIQIQYNIIIKEWKKGSQYDNKIAKF